MIKRLLFIYFFVYIIHWFGFWSYSNECRFAVFSYQMLGTIFFWVYFGFWKRLQTNLVSDWILPKWLRHPESKMNSKYKWIGTAEKKGASRSQMVAAKFQASNSFVEPYCHIICRPHANRSGNKYIDVVLMGEFNRHSKWFYI